MEEFDAEEQERLATYLNLRRLRDTQRVGADLTGFLEKHCFSRVIEKARRAYPLEFAERVEIYIEKGLLELIKNEALASNQEQLERICMLAYDVKFDGNSAKLTVSDVYDWKRMLAEVGEPKRTSTGVATTNAHACALAHSTPEKQYSTFHTHVGGNACPSVTDISNHLLGRIGFVAATTNGRFFLVPYRGDSKHYYSPEQAFVPQENLEIIVMDNGRELARGKGILNLAELTTHS